MAIGLNLTVAGSVATFDRDAFRTSCLAGYPAASDVIITSVVAASVVVSMQLVFATVADAQTVSAAIQSSSPSALSNALQVSVVTVSSPIVTYDDVPATALTTPQQSDSGAVVIIAAVVSVVVLLALLGFAWQRHGKRAERLLVRSSKGDLELRSGRSGREPGTLGRSGCDPQSSGPVFHTSLVSRDAGNFAYASEI